MKTEGQRVDINCVRQERGEKERKKERGHITSSIPLPWRSTNHISVGFSQSVTMTTSMSPSQLSDELVSQIDQKRLK